MKLACNCLARRWSKACGAALPAATAILLPKCPLCIGAWVAAATGLTLPALIVGAFRPLLLVACAFSAFLLLRPALARIRSRLSSV